MRDNEQRPLPSANIELALRYLYGGFLFMATDKKSFLLYCDIIHTVEQLTDEQAGHLFKHILQYVNDKDPETDNVITKIAFEPIKQSLKRDLQKYEDIRKRNSENARKRWDATAYDRIPNDTKNADSDSVSDSDSDSVIIDDDDVYASIEVCRDVYLKDKKLMGAVARFKKTISRLKNFQNASMNSLST